MVIKIADAILSLNPNAEVVVRDIDNIEWHNDTPEILKADIQSKQAELQSEYDAQEYARKRKAEYPSIEECVHAILDDDLENLQILRQAVKEKFPKT